MFPCLLQVKSKIKDIVTKIQETYEGDVRFRLSSTEVMELSQHLWAQRLWHTIYFSVSVREATRLRVKGLHLIESESSQTRFSARAEVILHDDVLLNMPCVAANIGISDGQEISVHEVVHEQKELGLCSRTLCD